MSKKSVVIALPARAKEGGAGEPAAEADHWVHAAIQPEASAPLGQPSASAAAGLIDLRADRNLMQLTWLIWSFPAMAALNWMARAFAPRQPRPR